MVLQAVRVLCGKRTLKLPCSSPAGVVNVSGCSRSSTACSPIASVHVAYSKALVHEEKPSDLTCVAKLTDRVIGRLNSARQLKPVEEERNLCEQDTHLRR